MAYKFQRGDAILSGALLQEGNVEIESGFELVIGNASLTEAELEQIDGITAGTVAASKAVVVDANKDADGFRNVSGSGLFEADGFGAGRNITAGGSITAGTSFIIGSADLSESDMEKLDGITDGTVAANKAVVVDGNKDANGFRNVDGTGDLTMATITMTGFSVDSDGDLSAKSLVSTTTISGALELQGSAVAVDGAGVFGGALSGSSKLELGGTVQLDGVASVVAAAADLVYFRDATDDLMKSDSFADVRDNLIYASVSGDATVAAGGALTIAAGAVEHGMLNDNIISGQDELAHADIADADELMISDAGTVKRVGVDSLRDHYYGSVSGDATIADGGALTIAADAVEPSMMSIFDDSLAATDTHIMIADGSDYSSFALSGDVTMTNAGVVTIAAGAVESGMLNNEVISGQTELAADGLAAADELLISDGGVLKKIGVDNLFLDGPGLLGEAAVAVGTDYLMFLDGGATGDAKKESIADLASAFAGTGLKATSGVLALDAQELSQAAVASGDFFVFEDATDNSTKKESVDDLATLFAGTGLAAASAVLSLDLNELSAAAVDVSADSIAIIDANDSNGTRKESIADLVSAMAGSGLSAASGQLSVTSNNVALKADGDTLAEGYNYFADISAANVGVDLPASPTVGDVVHAKAGNVSNDKVIRVSAQGSHTIDGESTIDLESPYAAVSFVYVAANAWRIV